MEERLAAGFFEAGGLAVEHRTDQQVLLLCVELDEGRTEALVREAVEARQPGAVNVTRGEDRLVAVALNLVLRYPDDIEVPCVGWRSLALVRLCERRQAIGRFHE